VLQVVASTRADVGVRIWNPDGSLAEKSGNGLRILAWYLHHRRGAAAELTVEVGGEIVACVVDGAVVEVEMGTGVVDAPDPIVVGGTSLPILRVSVGNPHCVVFREEADLDALPWRAWGEALERHPLFPNRTNVQVARRMSHHRLEARIWERGAGPTLASGSSACAVALVRLDATTTSPRWAARRAARTW
jgi:diaminopimelate epimerase